MAELLDMPFTAIHALAEAASKRQRTAYIAEINAARIAQFAPKDYKAAIREIDRA